MPPVTACCSSDPAGMEADVRARQHEPQTRAIHAHAPRIRLMRHRTPAVSAETTRARMGTADRPSVRGQFVGLSLVHLGNVSSGRYRRFLRGLWAMCKNAYAWTPRQSAQVDGSSGAWINWVFGNKKPGNDLLSHRQAAVPSARQGLTSVFGMGTGGSPAP